MVPFAVHIADGVLTAPWLAGGFAVTAVLAFIGSLRVRDEEIPRIALLTAAFFVASLLHVRMGPTSVHLLLNGLVGVVLGWHAAVAIPVGLFLQAVLIGHGGLLSLGVNACVMTLPALLAGGLFRLVVTPRGDRAREFALGLVIAAGTVVGTALLAALVLLVGGVEQWNSLAVFVFLAHLPLAAVEGVIVGFTVCFLARVKPELLPGAQALWQVPTSVADRPLAPEAAEPAFESRHEQRSAPNRKAPSCNQSPQSSR